MTGRVSVVTDSISSVMVIGMSFAQSGAGSRTRTRAFIHWQRRDCIPGVQRPTHRQGPGPAMGRLRIHGWNGVDSRVRKRIARPDRNSTMFSFHPTYH